MEMEKTVWSLTEDDIMWVVDLIFRDEKIELKLTEDEKEEIFRDISDHFGVNWVDEVEDILFNSPIVRSKES